MRENEGVLIVAVPVVRGDTTGSGKVADGGREDVTPQELQCDCKLTGRK